MQEEQTERGTWAENILRSYLNILLHELERNIEPTEPMVQRSNKENKLNLFEKMVDEEFSFSKGPRYYADALHISINYLNKICQEFRNTTCGEIIRKRIRLEAERYLHYTSLSVSEIAFKLGFESSSYFVTFFKQKNKITPEQYRKQQFQKKNRK
jgi:AraC-like DNA-binding protein